MAAAKLEVVKSGAGANPVYNSARRLALEGLSDLIRVLMENVDDALFALSDKVDNDRERNMYFEAMREIRIKREGLQTHFDYEMKQCFDRFVSNRSSVDDGDDEDELTLVELDDLEDRIAIDNMIKKARPNFEDELFALTERLKLVLRRKEIAEDENPLDPRAICECFHRASELLDTDIQVKLIFYKLFDRYVMNNLGHFYKELNDLLVEKGVLPGFKADQERMKQTTRFMANRIRKNAAQTPAVGLGTAPGNGDEVQFAGGNLFAALQQAVSGTAGGGPGAPGTVPVTGVAGAAAGGQPGGGPAVATGGGSGAGNTAGNNGFVAALSDLQSASFSAQPVTTVEPQSFRQATQQKLAAFRQQNHHHVDAADSQTIDVVSMLFDFFFDDQALPAPVKVLIGRLQIPILKVAIIDKDFFNQKRHPARKLLDTISRTSLGWGESHRDEAELISKIEEVVNFVINEFEQDIAVFEEACASFENFLNQEARQIEAAENNLRQQEARRDHNIQQAREAAAALVEKLTRDRELSFEVTDFLETTWTSVLFSAYLSLGESSNHWRNLKRISTTFVWTLIPKHTESDRSKIIKTIPALLRALSKGMDLISISTDVQNRIFRILAQEHAKIVKQTSKNIVTRIDDQTVWPVDDEARARAQGDGIDSAGATDFLFSADDTGEIEVIEDEINDESITLIDVTETTEVINDLNRFAAGVKQGKITVDEEIVLGTEDGDDFDLLVEGGDEFLLEAQALEIGSWVEFSDKDAKSLMARLSWKSNLSGNLVFVNRHGHKVRNLSIGGLANELRSGRARFIESSSVFDRAIHTIMSKMQH